MIEQPADLRVGVGDHPFVEDAMHAAWKGLVEMPEQPDIVAVITTQLGLIVAEALAAREMLLEVREAAIERMAAHIDDPGVRQDEVDKADMRPVVGHLVDEERPDRKSTRLNSSH